MINKEKIKKQIEKAVEKKMLVCLGIQMERTQICYIEKFNGKCLEFKSYDFLFSGNCFLNKIDSLHQLTKSKIEV